jgi:phage head maturation protease
MDNIKMQAKEITFSIKVSATDFPKREISGRIVTWNETGSTSAGETSFLPHSITFGDKTKLLLEHRRESPIGFLKSYKVSNEGIDAVFSVGNTTAGSDALVEASSGLRDGFSVGVIAQKYKNIDGILTISASSLKEVSLVTDPAIASALVSVAASENQDSDSVPGATETEETSKPSNEGENEVETTPTVPDAPAETVEASKVVNLGHVPLHYTKPRSPIVDMGSWVEHSIKASLNPNSDSAIFVAAANDDLGTTNPGFNPTRQLTEIVNGLSNSTRGAIDAISRGTLPDAGLEFQIPKITAVATVAAVAEGGAVSNTGVTSEYLSIPISRYAGRNILTQEIIDRSSPAFFNELLMIMASSMALAQTTAAAAQIKADASTVATPQALTAAGLIGYVSEANAAVYSNTQKFARNLLVSPAQWAKIMGYNDNGTPLFNAYFPSNQAGAVNGQSQVGLVLGLNFFVDNSGTFTGTADDSMVVLEPGAFTWYESPNFRLDVNKPSDGTVEISLNSYGSIATKLAAGGQMFNFT